jgi:hypothetical protein
MYVCMYVCMYYVQLLYGTFLIYDSVPIHQRIGTQIFFH